MTVEKKLIDEMTILSHVRSSLWAWIDEHRKKTIVPEEQLEQMQKLLEYVDEQIKLKGTGPVLQGSTKQH